MTSSLFVRRVSNEYLRREKDIHVGRFLLGLAVVLLPTILLLLLLVNWQNHVYRLGYQLTLLEHNRAKLEEKKHRLLLEREELRSPAALDQEAERNGLRVPDSEQVVTYREP